MSSAAERKKWANRKPRQIRFVRPWLYPKQEAFLFTPKRYSVVEAATKTGKTFGCLVWLVEQAAIHGGPNKNYWWVAPVYGQAEIAFRRAVAYCPAKYIRVNNSKLTITLLNGATIWFKSAEKPDALYGEDVYAAVIDEATRVREASWIAVRSTLTATRGHVRIIGNVKGRKNWAYRLARRAEGNPDGPAYHARLTAYDAVDAGIIPLEEIADAQATMPPEAFQELYLAIPSENTSNPFGLDNIRKCGNGGLAAGPAIAYGVDLARKQDWTVIVGLNRKMEVCYFARFQKPWPDTEDAIILATKQTPTLLDATGVGDPVVQHVQAKNRNAEGFIYTPMSKQDLMQDLSVGVGRQKVRFPWLPEDEVATKANDPRLICAEMKEFEYEYTNRGVLYLAPEGFHDDCVNALALAYRMATHGNIVPAVKPYTEKPYSPFAV